MEKFLLLYLVFLKLFYLLYSGLLVFPLVISCLQNHHFAMIIYYPTFGFSSFLAVSITDKPINRSIHAYALTQLNVFALRVFIFLDIHKKTRKEFEQFGLLHTNKKSWKMILTHAHLWRGSTQIEYSSQKMAQHYEYENSELD